MKKTKIIIIAAAAVVVILLGWGIFSKNNNEEYKFAKVELGDLREEITETGYLEKGEAINLSFKTSGRLEKIYALVGEAVAVGDWLARLDAEGLRIQLNEAKAALEFSEAKLAKLLAGATNEEVALAEAKVASAEAALEAAEKNLEDTKMDAEEDLRAAHEDGLNGLDEAHLKITNAYNGVSSIQSSYFYYSDIESTKVKESREIIGEKRDRVKMLSDLAKSGNEAGKIEDGLKETKEILSEVYGHLDLARQNCDQSFYRTKVLDADRTILDNHKSYIIAERDAVSSLEQTIASTKIANQININAASSSVLAKTAALEEAKRNLEVAGAAPTEENISLAKAEVRQSEAKANLLQSQINDSVLKSPVSGIVSKVEKRQGETIGSLETVIVIIPNAPFQIKVDVYEEDIAKITVFDPVEIELVAFPGKIILGKVVEISPAEKVVDEVVYYEVTVDFSEAPEGLKPGMTTDVVIVTDSRQMVLVLPKEALVKKDGKSFVKALKNGKPAEKEIEVGLFGNNGLVEIVSGLYEADEVIIP